ARAGAALRATGLVLHTHHDVGDDGLPVLTVYGLGVVLVTDMKLVPLGAGDAHPRSEEVAVHAVTAFQSSSACLAESPFVTCCTAVRIALAAGSPLASTRRLYIVSTGVHRHCRRHEGRDHADVDMPARPRELDARVLDYAGALVVVRPHRHGVAAVVRRQE